MHSSPSNRRAYKRVGVSIPAYVNVVKKPGVKHDAEILDISLGGAFVHCVAPILIGEQIVVEIRFSEARLQMEGKVIDYEAWIKDKLPDVAKQPSIVRWARGTSSHGFGVEFTNLTKERSEFLDKLVEYYDQLAKAGVSFSSPDDPDTQA